MDLKKEFGAIEKMVHILQGLDAEQRTRAIEYVSSALKINTHLDYLSPLGGMQNKSDEILVSR